MKIRWTRELREEIHSLIDYSKDLTWDNKDGYFITPEAVFRADSIKREIEEMTRTHN